MGDIIQVLRIVQYVGPRKAVEEEIEHSIHGTRTFNRTVRVTATTLGAFPLVLPQDSGENDEES